MSARNVESLRRPIAGDVPLSKVIDPLVKEGELYEKLPEGVVHCYACAHHCKIKPGARGVCQVRYNVGGTLYVPYGYASAVNCDPIEKKPFFHVHPGSDVLTFGMLGCDIHCAYCFTPDTMVITDRGPMSIEDTFQLASDREVKPDATIAYPPDLCAISGSGNWQRVEAVFQHHYKGRLAIIRPYYLPPLRCTPDHRVYATDDVTRPPEQIQAQQLTNHHYLAIPRRYAPAVPQTVDVVKILSPLSVTYRTPWGLSIEDRQAILTATAQGETSRQIGSTFGKSASYIRHVRSMLAQGHGDTRTGGVQLEEGTLRFPKEHRPGVPATIPIDERFARLLGYYCAEGSIGKSLRRPNSHNLNFSFAPTEMEYAQEVCTLLHDLLGLTASMVKTSTTLRVTVSKASAAHLLKTLCGGRASEKHVPQQLFHAPLPVVNAFLTAFVRGDGHRYTNGKISVTTVSTALAYGVAWLVLRSGHLPSLYDARPTATGTIQGRTIRRSPHQYTIVWYEAAEQEEVRVSRRIVETADYYLIPVREFHSEDYDGNVYNMQVEQEHNYLAGLMLVSNCQNWDISQALRDADAGGAPARVTAQKLVQLARQYGARGIASSYNEPLITSEWAMDIFKLGKQAGLTCMYVSNGNATREVLEYIRPYTDAYKIDLKSMRDASYRSLGAVLEHILDSIRMVHQMGFWTEIVTLIVPGFNDSEDELRDAARFIKSVSPDIPWHVTAFHSDYKMSGTHNTGAPLLVRAAEIGYAEGLHYVYAGNLPGHTASYEDTFCPNCHAALIERSGFRVRANRLTPNGTCPQCGTPIPGIW